MPAVRGGVGEYGELPVSADLSSVDRMIAQAAGPWTAYTDERGWRHQPVAQRLYFESGFSVHVTAPPLALPAPTKED